MFKNDVVFDRVIGTVIGLVRQSPTTTSMRRALAVVSFSFFLVASHQVHAQAAPPGGMQHMPGMQHPGSEAQATQGGQAAFAAITEIVKLLEADSTTDWAKVDIEALRQHLIDMDAVTMRASVRATNTAGGMTMDVTGDPIVAASIRRMLTAHAPMLEAMGGWRATVAPIAGGMRFTVVASNAADTNTIARIRGLGFIGLMTQGAHHSEHHVAIAKGAGSHAHGTP